jgi:hypothetical protein
MIAVVNELLCACVASFALWRAHVYYSMHSNYLSLTVDGVCLGKSSLYFPYCSSLRHCELVKTLVSETSHSGLA